MKASLYTRKGNQLGLVDLPGPTGQPPTLLQLHGSLFLFDHPVYERPPGLAPIISYYCYFETWPVILNPEVIPQLKRRST